MIRFVALAVVLAACTPLQVHEYAATQGLELSWEEAEHVAGWIDTDCLPDVDADVRVECGIRDSHRHYRLDELGISLETWQRVAWCESRLDPAAVNPRSGALGLFQHIPRFWPDRLDRSGWDHVDGQAWDDARIAAFVSAYHAVEAGGLTPWNASRGCWS